MKKSDINSRNNANDDEHNGSSISPSSYPEELPNSDYKMQLVWRNIIIFIIIHVGAIYGYFVVKKSWSSLIFCVVYGLCGGLGITAGAHRLFSHKAYKANIYLKLMLIYFQSIAFQNSIYEWSRDHRVHHKFCDTNADPHNSRRGFFFSHMGWLLCKKHEDVRKWGKKVDMSDLKADKWINFQHRYYLPLAITISIIIPTLFLQFVCDETFLVSLTFGVLFRYTVSLHITWLINSAAHMFGMKPFDENISPVENKVVGILALGEGFHNYHHVFPWDYKTSEFGDYSVNFTTAFLDFFSWVGWATDLKTVSKEMIMKRAKRTGDGTYEFPEDLFDENRNEITFTKT